MNLINNKKAQNLDGTGFNVVTIGNVTMSNITQFSQGKQVEISEHQLERFLDFIDSAEDGFNSLQTLVRLIMEKSEKHTTAYTLAAITWDKLDDWMSACHEEVKFFKEHSPKVAKAVAKEFVA
jgi:virulence-associated protein VapD